MPPTNTTESPPPERPTPSIFDLRARLNQNFQRVEAMLADIENMKDNPSAQIAAAAEMRQNIALAQKMTETILKTEALQNVENLVISILSEAGPTVRRKLIDKLNEAASNPP